MSFLNSVLSSITTGPSASAPSGPPKSPAPPPKAPPGPGRLISTNGVPTTQAPKRKASGDVGAAVLKAPRKDGPPSSEYNGTAKPVAARPITRPSSAGPSNIPYRGTVRPNPPSSTKNEPKPIAKPPTNASSSSAPKPASKAVAPAATSVTAGPPATLSSYKARIAAARAAQETAPPPGTLRHKPTQKELLAQKAVRRQTLSKTKTRITAGRPGKDVKAVEPVREKKPVMESGYKGTIRPKSSEPTYSGTARTGPVSRPQKISSERNYDRYSAQKSGGRYKYATYSDEEEEDNYASDGSSDMEAGALDLDEEEELSLRQARAEDAAALREENELKRKKLARKQQMEKLVADAQARKEKRF